jgi:NitT/TauT family transport system substrate-binding protein
MISERIRMYRFVRALVASALVLGLVGPAAAGAQPKELHKLTLMLNWYPYGEHAAFYDGLAKGFYKDEGIDLTIQAGGGSTQTVQAVAAGKVDIGYADTPALLKNVAAGASVKSIGVILQSTPAAIQFFDTQHITSVAQMKGHSVAGSPGDAAYETLDAVLEANHVAPGDVQRINVDPSGKLVAVISGRADSLVGFYNDQAPTIEARTGKKVDLLRYVDNGVNFFATGLVASDDTIAKQKPLLQAFVRATQRAYADAIAHRADAVAAETKLAEKPPAPEVLTKQWELTIALLHTPRTKNLPVGVDDENDWKTTIGVVSKYLGLGSPGAPSAYWDPSIAKK